MPDETDIEDLSGDDDEVQIQNTSRILKDNNFHPVALDSTPTKASIDLTSDEQFPTSSIRAEMSTSTSGTEKKSSIMNLVDLTSMENEEPQSEQEVPEEEVFGSFMSDVSYDDQDDGQDSGNLGVNAGEARVSLSDALGVTQDSAWSSPSASPLSRSRSPYSEASVASDASFDGDNRSIRSLEAEFFGERNRISPDSDIDEGTSLPFDFIVDTNTSIDDVQPVKHRPESRVHDSVTNNFQSGSHDDIPMSMSGAISSSDLPEQSESSGAPSATVDAKSYMLNTQLPPMNPPTKLPSLSAAQFAPLPNMKLPPIFDAMERPAHASVPVPSQISAAQELGAKTGKMEYFTAREENRMNLQFSSPVTHALPTYQPYDWTQFAENPKCQPLQALPETAKVPELRREPQVQAQAKPPCAGSRLPEQSDAKSGALQDSGARFLNSPPKELPVPSLHAKDPPLDDTSAFQFEMSKRAADTARLAERSAKVVQKTQQYLLRQEQLKEGPKTFQHTQKTAEESSAINNVEETVQPQTKSAKKQSLKRKVEEISLLTPEEQHSEEARGLGHALEPEEAPRTARCYVHRDRSMHLGDSRPTKRLRRVAEAFGIAALGGAAVMGALIATAPTF